MHILAQFPWLFLFSLFLFIFRPPKASLGAISVSLGAAGNILPPTVPMKGILIAPLELHSLFPSSPMWGPRWPPRAWKLPGLGATWVSRQGTTDPSSQQVLWRWCSALRCCLLPNTLWVGYCRGQTGFFSCAPTNADHRALPVVEPNLLQPKSQAACYRWPKTLVPAPSHVLCSPHLAQSQYLHPQRARSDCASPSGEHCLAI